MKKKLLWIFVWTIILFLIFLIINNSDLIQLSPKQKNDCGVPVSYNAEAIAPGTFPGIQDELIGIEKDTILNLNGGGIMAGKTIRLRCKCTEGTGICTAGYQPPDSYFCSAPASCTKCERTIENGNMAVISEEDVSMKEKIEKGSPTFIFKNLESEIVECKKEGNTQQFIDDFGKYIYSQLDTEDSEEKMALEVSYYKDKKFVGNGIVSLSRVQANQLGISGTFSSNAKEEVSCECANGTGKCELVKKWGVYACKYDGCSGTCDLIVKNPSN